MSDPDFRRRLRETFQAEAAEHVAALSRAAFELEAAPPAAHGGIVERIFRETHTLKGAARMVGEAEAESLCQALEQQLSTLKQAEAALSPATIADLHRQIGSVTRSLGLQIPPTDKASALSAPPAEAPAVAAGHVRVPGERLDALLRRAEEMVSAKLSGDQRTVALRELADRSSTWKKEWELVRSDLMAVRRFIDSAAPSPIAKELKALVHHIEWTHDHLRVWQRDLTKLAQAGDQDQRRLGTMLEQFLDESKEVLMQPFSALLEMFPGFVREIAVQQGKEIELVIHGAGTEIDRRVLEELKDALVHLVRNAVDHGIETAAARRAAGKPARGQLTIAVQEKAGGNVEIAVSDDGRGIDSTEVTATARRLGVLPDDAPALSHDDALALLFTSGFSTRSAPSDLSGRGLGLAIVAEKAEQIGGSVSVESTRDRGTTFRFLLPITLARFRGVFVTAHEQSFVIPSAYVRRVVRVKESAIKRVKAQELVDLDGTSVVVVPLAEVLGIPAPKALPRRSEATAVLVVVASGRTRLALRLDAVPQEQEIVMKSLGKMLRRTRHYVGATIVGAGHIVPVLNVSHLLGALARANAGPRPARAATSKPAAPRTRRILVTEDSITSRSLLKNILQTAGFQVLTAVDGVDALTTLKFEPVDLVISDVQMPRLDGFELTAKIRADSALSTLPVILITSLASREDKARGVEAGANAYIVKSSFDQSDLLSAIGRLIP